jgi:hypothetical protein
MNRWKWIVTGLAVVAAAPVLTKTVIELTKPDVHSFSLRHLSGTEAADLLTSEIRYDMIEGWGDHEVYVRVHKRNRGKVAAILSAHDKPKPQVALHFQLIEADGFGGRDSAIAKVESALRGLFRFQGYRLVAEAFMRTKGNSESSQNITGQDEGYYAIRAEVGDVQRRADKTSADLKVVLSGKGYPILTTSVQVPDGQTVVLGTAQPMAGKAALILVVTPEIR